MKQTIQTRQHTQPSASTEQQAHSDTVKARDITAHHHQIAKLSHSINAIGPAPHRGVTSLLYTLMQQHITPPWTA
jgi:hypothetical protein